MRRGEPKSGRFDPMLLLVLATALLLPALGILQVRWLERWSDAERARMRSNLVAGVFLLGEEVDRAVAAASEALDVSSTPPRERAAVLAAKVATWRARAPYPELIGAVELVERTPGGVELRRQPISGPAGEAPSPPLPVLAAAEGARVVCGDGRADRPPQLVFPLGDAAWVVATLDQGYLLDHLVPGLLSFFFTGRDPSARIVATVSEHGDGVDALAAYPAGVPRRPLEHEDASYNFLSLRIRDWLFLGQPLQAVAERGSLEPSGCWTIRVAHRAGSLEAAVATLRRGQTAASFGVLALLAVTSGALVVAARRSARLSRQQLEFVAGVTHELRTPLSVIRSAGDNLAKGLVADADRVAEYGRLVRAEGRRLSEMVENVLRLSRVGYGSDDGPRQPVRVIEVIETAVAGCQGLCAGRDARVTIDDTVDGSAETVGGELLGDRDALVCAVRNLLSNAVKHGPAGQTVRVAVERRPGSLSIAVTDQGEGIPESERRRVFDAFYRGRSARRRGVPGAGLGLALVRRVAELHDGTVEIDGRTIALVLPLAPVRRAQGSADA